MVCFKLPPGETEVSINKEREKEIADRKGATKPVREMLTAVQSSLQYIYIHLLVVQCMHET